MTISHTQESDIDRLANKFEPRYSVEELRQIRLRIAQHVDTIAQTTHINAVDEATPTIPAYIQGCRRRYLAALRSNAAAKRRLDELQDDLESRLKPSKPTAQSGTSSARGVITDNRRESVPDTSPTTLLSSHLELSSVRRLCEQLDGLNTSVKKLEELAVKHSIYDTADIQDSDIRTTLLQQHKYEGPSTDAMTSFSAQIHNLTKQLETAVIQATNKLQHERDQLNQVKSTISNQSSISTSTTIAETDASKLRALTATRAELTRWIESCLESCDSQLDQEKEAENTHSETHSDGNNMTKTPNTMTETDIEQIYESYLSTRSQLITTISNLTALQLPITTTTTINPSRFTTTTTSVRPLPSSNPNSNPNPTLSPSNKLAQISTPTFLPLHNLTITLLSTHTTHLTNLFHTSRSTLLSTLSNLRHESQLLHSSHFSHHDDSITHNKEDNMKEENDEEAKEINRLLEQWKVADRERSIRNREVIRENVERGWEFVEMTRGVVRGIEGREEAWRTELC